VRYAPAVATGHEAKGVFAACSGLEIFSRLHWLGDDDAEQPSRLT